LPDGKTHMVRGIEDPEIPWTALLIGLWIPNFFYWGLNQYITQRTLGFEIVGARTEGHRVRGFPETDHPLHRRHPGHPGIQPVQRRSEGRRGQPQRVDSVRAFSRAVPQSVRRHETRSRGNAEPGNWQRIQRNLESPAVADRIPLYVFNKTFAELHPEDAAAIVADGWQRLASRITIQPAEADGTPAEQLAASSEHLARVARNAMADQVAVETLVAHDYDNAFPTLIRRLMPVGWGIKGFVLAAIFGAVVSSLASMLNSASTIATMDIYRKLRKGASQYELVTAGRVFVVLFVLIAMTIAPMLGHPAFGGIFTFIQEFQGFISPGILAIFLFGLLIHRAPRHVGTVGLLLNPVLYGVFKFSPSIPVLKDVYPLQVVANWSFLDRMALCFGIVIAVLTVMTLVAPLKKPIELPVNEKMNVESSKGAMICGAGVVVLTLILYVIFWSAWGATIR
jgi:solute:Na+ symporter, SSS family